MLLFSIYIFKSSTRFSTNFLGKFAKLWAVSFFILVCAEWLSVFTAFEIGFIYRLVFRRVVGSWESLAKLFETCG